MSRASGPNTTIGTKLVVADNRRTIKPAHHRTLLVTSGCRRLGPGHSPLKVPSRASTMAGLDSCRTGVAFFVSLFRIFSSA